VQDVERALSSLERRIERRRRTQRAVAAAALVSVCLLGFFSVRGSREPLAQAPLHTRDGSQATLVEPDTQLQVQRDSESEVVLALARGTGHFDVTKRPTRRYRVRAGQVDVQVLGTVFDVERRGERSRVHVVQGAVRVGWPGGHTVLRAGESGWFPRTNQPAEAAHADNTLPGDAAPPVAADRVGSTAALAAELTPPHQAQAVQDVRAETTTVLQTGASHDRRGPRREAWRSLARAGKHREAFRSLDRAPVEDLEGLLLAADAARLSDHPRDAAKYLERLVREYPETAPARLAAFTLGGLQLQELRDPARAARSFARAYTLDPEGPLAGDALAREAEALTRAGQTDRAAEVARRYLTRFPQGVRRAELQRYLAP